MTLQVKWARDLFRNRARIESAADAGAPFAFRNVTTVQSSCTVAHFNGDGSPAPCPGFHGPRTIGTDPAKAANEVETLLRGLAVPVVTRSLHAQHVAAIRNAMRSTSAPKTADQIADYLCTAHPEWNRASVKRRVSDAGLLAVDDLGVSAKHCPCLRYQGVA